MSVVMRVGSLLLGAALLIAAYWSYRLGKADLLIRQDTPESRDRAADLVPGNADYHSRKIDGDDAKRKASLEAAVAANTYYSKAWIELGLIAEQENRHQQAERYLLEAARVDKGYSPRWTLASYYFRQHREEDFWHWTREALKIYRGNATALYRLCWSFSDNPAVIVEKAIPDSPDQLADYLLLFTQGRTDYGRRSDCQAAGVKWK